MYTSYWNEMISIVRKSSAIHTFNPEGMEGMWNVINNPKITSNYHHVNYTENNTVNKRDY